MRTILAALVASLSLAACATSDEPTSSQGAAIEGPSNSEAVTINPGTAPDTDGNFDDNPCACPNAECRTEWIRKNLGCNLTATIECDDQGFDQYVACPLDSQDESIGLDLKHDTWAVQLGANGTLD